MANEKARVRIELTDEQQKQIKDTAGYEIAALEFDPQELEPRIAPDGAVAKPYMVYTFGTTFTTK